MRSLVYNEGLHRATELSQQVFCVFQWAEQWNKLSLILPILNFVCKIWIQTHNDFSIVLHTCVKNFVVGLLSADLVTMK